MKGSSSAPTARVIDVLELLIRAGDDARLRFVDVSRELGITQATAHSILKTLCDKGWATRDPVDKSFSFGPAVAAIATRTDLSSALARAARSAAAELSSTTGFSASIIERLGDSLVITAFHGIDIGPSGDIPGDRIPFVPPFGVAFAAFESPDEQKAWIQRGRVVDATVEDRLRQLLAQARERGFDVDWMTPALKEAAQMVDNLDAVAVPPNVRETLQQLRAEFTTVGYLAEDDPQRHEQPVATISAPVFDQHGRVSLIVCVHPLRPLTPREVYALGDTLAATTSALNLPPGATSQVI
jgi:DNA-binding IclR family transcriptional regulator